MVAPPVNAEPQRTSQFIDLEPDDPSSQNEGVFMAEVPPSQPYFDLTGDEDRIAPFRDWTSPSSQWESEIGGEGGVGGAGGRAFHTTTKPKRTID